MKAVIMCAGESTRTAPLTLTRPKPLLPVLNKPILQHQLEALAPLVDEVILIVGYKQEMIRERFGSSFGAMKLTYVEQRERRGTGHALLQVRHAVSESFIAMNGDDLYETRDLERLAAEPQAALCREVGDPRLFGVFELDTEDRVLKLVEKPAHPATNLANVGAYKLPAAIFEILESTPASERGEIEITSAIQTLAETAFFKAVRMEGYWLPIGYPWDLIAANEFMVTHALEPGIHGSVHRFADVADNVYIGKGAEVRAGVVIEGPSYIGEHASIGPNCWLRPGSIIGDHCRVGHGVEIKNSVLMEGAHASHLNYVGDSVIGAHANLGCGTIIANLRHDGKNQRAMVKGQYVDTGRRKLGAIIGDDVHTGINTSILPGRMLWPGSATLPGEVISKNRERKGF